MFEVRLKPGHPTGTYHRAGREFTSEPVKMELVPATVAKDPWLVVTRIEDKKEGVLGGKQEPKN